MDNEQWTMDNENVTQRVKKWLDDVEEMPLLIATKVGVWLVPAVPAYFAHRAIIQHLETSTFWGWLGAIALEIVGVAAIKGALRAYTWNLEKSNQDKEAPLKLYTAALGVYFASAFLIVLILELWPVVSAIVPAVYVVLGGVAMLNVALADNQKRLETERAERLAERKQKRKKSKKALINHKANNHPPLINSKTNQQLTLINNQINPQINGNNGKIDAKTRLKLLKAYYKTNPTATQEEVGQHVGRTRGWVSQQLSQLEKTGEIERNNNGVIVLEGGNND